MKKTKYPDGQITVFLDKEDTLIKLTHRINSYEDLFTLKALSEVLKHNNETLPELTIPCLFGQRSDRRFQEHQSFDLKIICDFINDCNFPIVNLFDPHSDVSLALINNSRKISSFEYVKEVIKNINSTNLGLVSPDAGAYKKVYKYAEDLKLPLVAANKFRDLDGNITLSILGDIKGKDCFIVDDLCSRGGTFIKLTEELKKQGASKVYLYVSHFEGGCNEYKQTIQNLKQTIDGIYTTDSFRNFDEDDVKNITVFNMINLK